MLEVQNDLRDVWASKKVHMFIAIVKITEIPPCPATHSALYSPSLSRSAQRSEAGCIWGEE